MQEHEKLGNDKADVNADKGTIEDDERLHDLADHYSHRQRYYGYFMQRVKKYIIGMRKADRELREKIKLREHPLKDPTINKMLIPLMLNYGETRPDQGHEACANETAQETDEIAEEHKISIRRPEAHDEPDAGKRFRLQKLRNFIAEIRWNKIGEEPQVQDGEGATWLELYILYCMHGGWSIETESMREVKLKKNTTLSAGIKRFKAEVNLVRRPCINEQR